MSAAENLHRELNEKQKKTADQNLEAIAFLINASNESYHDAQLIQLAEGAQPDWSTYNPVIKKEHIYRYPVRQEHEKYTASVRTVFLKIVSCLHGYIESRKMPIDWQNQIVERSQKALLHSDSTQTFVLPRYPAVKFTVYHFIFMDDTRAKLFVLIANDIVPYDFFFYFF